MAAPKAPHPWNRQPLPAAFCRHGRGRAARIRVLYAQRCSPEEIATWLRVSVEEVRRTLHRPVRLAA